MKTAIRRWAIAAASSAGVGVTSASRLQQYRALETDIATLLALPEERLIRLVGLLSRSTAQLHQDLFVLNELGFKRGGYFVEFGATNGRDLSNTYLLEKEFDWQGILAEPARCWHTALTRNRSCALEFDCVWRESGATLQFRETGTAEFSTISDFRSVDLNTTRRGDGVAYSVRTISLADLLHKHDAPAEMDFLSIDTEGSEYEILQAFDFDRYRFRVIAVEHNYTPSRQRLEALLSSRGYRRKFEGFSRWDDWYVLG